MPTFSKFLLAILTLVALERGIRTQTEGFCLEKTKRRHEARTEWNLPASPPPLEILNQPFYFLGSGVQSYSFLSEDQQYVLKLFKHYHLLPSKKSEPQKKRMNALFSSALLAFKELKETTGLLYLQINPPASPLPTITLYDKIGVKYAISLSDYPFLIQKKGALLLSYISEHPEEVGAITRSLLACIDERSNKGIANSDLRIERNFCVCEGSVIEIDVGSFHLSPYLERSGKREASLYFPAMLLRKALAKHMPDSEKWILDETLDYLRIHPCLCLPRTVLLPENRRVPPS